MAIVYTDNQLVEISIIINHTVPDFQDRIDDEMFSGDHSPFKLSKSRKTSNGTFDMMWNKDDEVYKIKYVILMLFLVKHSLETEHRHGLIVDIVSFNAF